MFITKISLLHQVDEPMSYHYEHPDHCARAPVKIRLKNETQSKKYFVRSKITFYYRSKINHWPSSAATDLVCLLIIHSYSKIYF